MKEYTIIRRPAQLDWTQIPALQMDELFNTAPLPISASAQLCYDDEALYVHLQAVEENIRAEYTGLLDEVCEDSCLEFFFSPLAGDERYFNIECNPNGALFLGFGPNVQEIIRLIPDYPAIVPQCSRTADGWEVCYAIPHSFVRTFCPDYAPAPGKTIRANCYKCGDLTPQPHYLCWCQVTPQPHAFHNPSRFGLMRFA